MNVYIGLAKDYSAMQWPCPNGFHIPSQSDWDSLKTIYDIIVPESKDPINHLFTSGHKTSWWYTSSGELLYPETFKIYKSSISLYWLSKWRDIEQAYLWFVSSDSISNWNTYFDGKATMYSIRPFSNMPVSPDNSWDVIVWTIWWNWIFRNVEKWLITLVYWNSILTISDKDLWASSTWQDWYIYQWGNNYWFNYDVWTYNSWFWTTLVNASYYWPWDYYSSNKPIFCRNSSSSFYYIWDSSNNNNLRWWVTWVVMVPAELKNAYIGKYYEWTPNANTVAYYPFKSDLNDYNGTNPRSITRGSATYSNNMVSINTIRHTWNFITGTWDFTINIYINFWQDNFHANFWSDDNYWYPRLRMQKSNVWLWSPENSWTWYTVDFTSTLNLNKNYLLTITRTGWYIYWYVNWEYIWNKAVPTINITWWLWCYIGWNYTNNSSWKVWNLIIENRAWTDDEILKFYNRSKANYWL